jgi:Asp-tRNA(Asn)/Glu-tRNA(Gln) amidotransferase A subunit family amidase
MTELSRMIAAKKVSPVEVVQAHLDRIAALDGKLKSYITVMGGNTISGLLLRLVLLITFLCPR